MRNVDGRPRLVFLKPTERASNGPQGIEGNGDRFRRTECRNALRG